ncbi:hypothetical protein NDU88_004288 [Pleurodeles waltl]|uniref:Uncharacterized protein n=1 Tax=Pleurodeles waltl TaxID=8319 RepID=A0AAV7UF74_PLEWA|nr:hypothetical protein NDU88_004288 [Pleurodeles waltl]
MMWVPTSAPLETSRCVANRDAAGCPGKRHPVPLWCSWNLASELVSGGRGEESEAPGRQLRRLRPALSQGRHWRLETLEERGPGPQCRTHLRATGMPRINVDDLSRDEMQELGKETRLCAGKKATKLALYPYEEVTRMQSQLEGSED